MAQEATPPEQKAVDVEKIRKEATDQAVVAERKRASEIGALARKHGMDEEFTGKLISGGKDLSEAREAILDALAARSEKGEVRSQVQVVRDEVDTRREAVENAIMHRYDPAKNELKDHGRHYRGLSLIEIGRELLDARGEKTRGLGRYQLAGMILGLNTRDGGGMLTSSDFPNILANVANKTLRAAYEQSPRTFVPFCREASAPDFKEVSRTQLGEMPKLKQIAEDGSYEYGSIGEGAEKYSLATFGRIVAITRKAIINDDLSAFTRIPAGFGFAAATMESDIVWAIITGNPAMADNKNLFSSDHANLLAQGTVINVENLGIGRAKIRAQKGVDGVTPLNISPAFLIVPTAKETIAQQYTSASYVSAKSSDVNPFASNLQPIVEPRLDANSTTAWYLAAQPGLIDTIEYSYLEGQRGVYIETRQGWDVDGVEIKAREDFAAKAIDYRGLYKNPGA